MAPIYAINVAAPNPWPQELVAGFNDSPTPTPDGKTLVFDRMSVAAPNEIYSAPLAFPAMPDGGAAKLVQRPRLPAFQGAAVDEAERSVLSQIEMQPLESFWFNGAAKEKVQGFLVKPPNFDASKKYPVKFLIHGGPQGAWGDDWSYRWNPELFAANGYVVMLHQLSRLHRLRPEVHRRHQRRLGRRSVPGPDAGPRLRRENLSFHRQGPRVRAGRKLRRLHD